jgi:hypothetical protein
MIVTQLLDMHAYKEYLLLCSTSTFLSLSLNFFQLALIFIDF